MPRTPSPPFVLTLPAKLDPDALPRFVTRRQMEQIHRQYFGPVTARSIQEWPLTWRIVGGCAVAAVEDFLTEAKARFDAAPVIRKHGKNPELNAA